uniref:histidine--tRNA ligase n=1 Tax=Apophlaea sinclairii TaxID=212746 RepID=A0A1C9CBT0_9FLOR|nr:histidine-tRNA synthetase [Apophlaea sinclairii]AOM65836.1 histidine-tRNA synthetase [Apophlaea sinclairii]
MRKIRGTHDILLEEIKYWELIVEKAKHLFERAKYSEVRTPIIEDTSLFTKTIGLDTDIISKEMYSFRDQNKRDITLRPEGTAGIVRSLVENKMYTSNMMNRIWYYGPMFRYERPQNGRQRQFHQIGVECFGTTSPRADVEIIYLVIKLLEQLRCNNLTLEINSIGTFINRAKYQEELKNYLFSYISELDDDSLKRLYTNPLRILDSKNTHTQKILSAAPKLYNFLDLYSKRHFEFVCQYLKYLNISYIINNKLVRGLDYYNNTAFEVKINPSDSRSTQTICGGGRYDNMIYQLGKVKVPAVGCAIGIERLYSLSKNRIKFFTSKTDIYIAAQGKLATQYSLFLMKFLRSRQFIVVVDFSNKIFKKQLKKANQLSAVVCFIIGDKEMLHKIITVKLLSDGTQEVFKQNQLHYYIQYLQNKVS